MTTRSAATGTTQCAPLLSIVIVNWNTRERLRGCLASIAEHLAQVDHEVLVVDNASADGSPAMVQTDFPAARLIRNVDNLGFGRANNQAMRIARGGYILLLNSDTELRDSSVADLLEDVRAEPSIGVAHCRLDFPDGRAQYTAYRFPRLSLALVENLGLYKLLPKQRAGNLLLGGYLEPSAARDVDWVAGAFMLIRREVFEQTAGFDESVFMYGEDLEWCYRIRDHGWRIRYYPETSIVHFDHVSSDIRWGGSDKRVLLCLGRQLDVYAQRHGRARAAMLAALGLIGALMRIGYHGARLCLSCGRSSVERTMSVQGLTMLRLMACVILDRRRPS